jgi:hypothetical protein
MVITKDVAASVAVADTNVVIWHHDEDTTVTSLSTIGIEGIVAHESSSSSAPTTSPSPPPSSSSSSSTTQSPPGLCHWLFDRSVPTGGYRWIVLFWSWIGCVLTGISSSSWGATLLVCSLTVLDEWGRYELCHELVYYPSW